MKCLPSFRNSALLAVVVLAAGIMVGCSDSKKTTTGTNPAVTDITPITPVDQAPRQPVQPITPSYTDSTPVNASGGTYVVQKGDTLYKIALDKYGDAKQWKKIAAANPEVPASGLIKPGQKLVIP